MRKPQTATQQQILATVCSEVYIHNRWIDLPLAILLVRNLEGKAADELYINDFFAPIVLKKPGALCSYLAVIDEFVVQPQKRAIKLLFAFSM